MSDRVVVTVEDGIADVRLNRPEKLNALDTGMFRAIVNAGEELKERSDVRVAVLSGEGRSFCAGLDFASFQAMGQSNNEAGVDTDDMADTAANSLEGRITHLGQQAAGMARARGSGSYHRTCSRRRLSDSNGSRHPYRSSRYQDVGTEIRWGLVPDMEPLCCFPL